LREKTLKRNAMHYDASFTMRRAPNENADASHVQTHEMREAMRPKMKSA